MSRPEPGCDDNPAWWADARRWGEAEDASRLGTEFRLPPLWLSPRRKAGVQGSAARANDGWVCRSNYSKFREAEDEVPASAGMTIWRVRRFFCFDLVSCPASALFRPTRTALSSRCCGRNGR